MKPQTLEDHLTAFYGATGMAPAQADRLAEIARASEHRADRSTGLGGWRYAIAACLGLLIVSVSLQVAALTSAFDRSDALAARTVGESSPAGMVSSPPEKTGYANGRSLAPRLVAMQFHMDGCPLTAETTPVFAELMEKYGDRDVIFTQYDITSPGAVERSSKLAQAIGVDGFYQGPYQSGVIELVDRETRQVVAVMHRRVDRPKFEEALAQALP